MACAPEAVDLLGASPAASKSVADLGRSAVVRIDVLGESVEGKPVTNPAATLDHHPESGKVMETHGDPTRLGVPAPVSMDIATALASLAESQVKMVKTLESLTKKVKAPAKKKATRKATPKSE